MGTRRVIVGRGRRVAAGLIAAALVIGNPLLHKSVSDVCDGLFAALGRGRYEWATLTGIVIISLVGLALVVRDRQPLRWPRLAVSLAGLVVLSVTAQRWLLVSNVELIHLPQFGLLAALLIAAGLGGHGAWLGAVIAGVADETYQHVVLYAGVPGTYFDYNDIVLNALGASWAVVMLAAGSVRPVRRSRWLGVGVLFAALVVLTLWVAPANLVATPTFPFRGPAVARALTGYDYHVMSAGEGVLALAVLWSLVAWALYDSSGRHIIPAAAAAAALWLTVVGCSERIPLPVSRPAPIQPASSAVADPSDTPFIITFWCGPPPGELTDKRAAEIAAAGFTVIGAPCEGTMTPKLNRRALDIAARHGLQMWIMDARMSQYFDLAPDWAARMDAARADYGDHPALGGYFLVDEPPADKFADLGTVVDRLRAIDPERMPYVNMLPDYAPADALGTPTYREHVERYMAEVRPPLLSFDYYPFKIDADRETFFASLALVRRVANRHGVPFLLIVQAMPHGRYRDPTEAEMAWQVNHALAFGARGISYFAYWTPVQVEGAAHWQFRRGLVEAGRPTARLAEVARINRAARAIAGELRGRRSVAIIDSTSRFAPPFPFGPFLAVEGGPVTAGFFVGSGMATVLLVNQDYRSPHRLSLRLRSAARPEIYDPDAEQWGPLLGGDVLIAAGGARLLRWTAPAGERAHQRNPLERRDAAIHLDTHRRGPPGTTYRG